MFGIKNTTLIRTAINLGVGVSTYGITTAIVKNNTAEPETLASKAALATGSFVLGTMVAETATAWTDRQLKAIFGIKEEWDNAVQNAKSDPK